MPSGHTFANQCRNLQLLWQGWAGFQPGGEVDTALWLAPPPPWGSIHGPQNPTKTDPRAAEVTRTQKPKIGTKIGKKNNENGIFGISASRGFRKIIICHVFGEKT